MASLNIDLTRDSDAPDTWISLGNPPAGETLNSASEAHVLFHILRLILPGRTWDELIDKFLEHRKEIAIDPEAEDRFLYPEKYVKVKD